MIETGAPAPGPDPVCSWEGVLDSLERDLEASERLVDHVRSGLVLAEEMPPAPTWAAPEGLGPLSEDLLARAQEIRARQASTALALTEALVEVRARQRRAVRTLPGDYPTATGSTSAYVDVTA